MSIEKPIESVPDHLRTHMQLYSIMFAVIDGRLQAEEQSVDVRVGPDRRRVYVRWAVPQAGLEWDGCPYVGTDRTCRVQVLQGHGELVINEDMRCVWFAVSHSVNKEATARAIFECGPANRNK